jgi:AcrR family transcriptional regulator
MQQRSEETRNRILQSAVDCFSNHGYDVSSVAEICTAAGVSKGAFYHHFPTKQTVFLALMQSWLGGVDEQLRAVMDMAEDVPTGFSQMSQLFGEVFTAAGGHLPMFLEFWTQSMRDPAVWEVVIAPYRNYQDLFAEFIQRGVNEGSLRPMDPQMGARWLLAMAMGLLLQGLVEPNEQRSENAQKGILLLVEGMKA